MLSKPLSQNPESLFDDISALAEFALSECSYYYFVLTLGRYIPKGLKNSIIIVVVVVYYYYYYYYYY